MDMDSFIEECIEDFKRDNKEDLMEGGCFDDWTEEDIRLTVLENIKDQTKIELRGFED